MNQELTTGSRFVGVRHRVKKTAQGEARPTQIAIMDGKKIRRFDLADETAELDFLLGHLPVKWREPAADEDLSKFLPHHIDWRELKKDEDFTQPERLRRVVGKKRYEVKKVPAAYEGFMAGDLVASVLGGSGDRFCFALSRRGEEIGASVFRIPGYVLKNERGAGDKNDDAELLACLLRDKQHLFYQVMRRDRNLIQVRECLADRMAAMKERIGAEQRLRQRSIGSVFCNEEGKYPEGSVEDIYKAARANNVIVRSLTEEEDLAKKRLAKVLDAVAPYTEVLSHITGMGPLIAAPILAAIVDIRRFDRVESFKAFCGLHVRADGTFVRGRRELKEAEGVASDEIISEEQLADNVVETLEKAKETKSEPKWNRMARQAFYLFVSEQCNRRPDSIWGQKLLEYKTKLRAIHPDVLCQQCGGKWDDCQHQKSHKRKYFDGHIHTMAVWRTTTKVAEWLFRELWKLERQRINGLPACSEEQKQATAA